MKVRVDPELCTGTGSCIGLCPEVFVMSEDGIAVVIVKEVPPELEEACRDAVEGCPVDAIKIEL